MHVINELHKLLKECAFGEDFFAKKRTPIEVVAGVRDVIPQTS
jgi:hypothetical protein